MEEVGQDRSLDVPDVVVVLLADVPGALVVPEYLLLIHCEYFYFFNALVKFFRTSSS
jgi:hypothetical protein